LQQTPEKIFTRIAANASDLTPTIDQDERRCKIALDEELEIVGQSAVNIDASQRCTAPFIGLVIDDANFPVPAFAPRATCFLKHDEFGRRDRLSNQYRCQNEHQAG